MRSGRKLLILTALLSGLISCGGGGDTLEGFGFDQEEEINKICADRAREYRGETISNSGNPGGIIRLTVNEIKECDQITGAIVFAPCVPVTGIRGSSDLILGGFSIVETVTTTPFLRLESGLNPGFEIDPDQPDAPIPPIRIYEYTLTTDGSNGCPLTDSGVVDLTRISAG